jgi:WW domain-containing oxidoreductase
MPDVQPKKYSSRTSADEILAGRDLSPLRIAITGCNAGIGFETARSLAQAGATIVLPCRDMEKSVATAMRIKETVPDARLEPAVMDLSDLTSVVSFAESQRDAPDSKKLDILICNAGVYPGNYRESAQGFELCFAVCHLGHFTLVRSLWPSIIKWKTRLVIVASGSHRSPAKINFGNLPAKPKRYSSLKAYGQAKLANVLFANELNRRLGDRGVFANSLHPGALIATSIGRTSWLAKVAIAFARPFSKSLNQGAATTVYCAVAPEAATLRGEYLDDCAVAQASDEARDSDVASRLWEVSEKLVSEAGIQLPPLT